MYLNAVHRVVKHAGSVWKSFVHQLLTSSSNRHWASMSSLVCMALVSCIYILRSHFDLGAGLSTLSRCTFYESMCCLGRDFQSMGMFCGAPASLWVLVVFTLCLDSGRHSGGKMKVQLNCNCKLEREMVEYTKIEEQDRKQGHL